MRRVLGGEAVLTLAERVEGDDMIRRGNMYEYCICTSTILGGCKRTKLEYC